MTIGRLKLANTKDVKHSVLNFNVNVVGLDAWNVERDAPLLFCIDNVAVVLPERIAVVRRQ